MATTLSEDRDSHLLSVAPMMGRTDGHFRFFLRLLSRRCLVYTEMVTTGNILHGDWRKALAVDPVEHPVVLQLGGDSPLELAQCARIAESEGFDEVNLNVGCPSPRVQSGGFGAALMLEPQRVADCVSAMVSDTTLPVTVKHRIGVDDSESEDLLSEFVSTVKEGGCRTFIVHARKAWLSGMSPKQNRSVPPLRYDWVYRLKSAFPELGIEINGGIESIDQALAHNRRVDGSMVGRAAYDNPMMLGDADTRVFGEGSRPGSDPGEMVDSLTSYAERIQKQGIPLRALCRHLHGLFRGTRGSRQWRRTLAEELHLGPAVLKKAYQAVLESR